MEVLDDCKIDAILLGGDILDYASTFNIECLKNGLDQLKTLVMYVRRIIIMHLSGVRDYQCLIPDS